MPGEGRTHFGADEGYFEILSGEAERLRPCLRCKGAGALKLAFHSPCTLQHGQKIKGVVEELW